MIMAVLGALLIGPPGPAGAEPASATDPVRAILILDEEAALAEVSAGGSDRAARPGSAERRQLDQRRTAIRTEQHAVVAAARKAGIALDQRRSLIDLINAVAVEVDPDQLNDLAARPGVAAVLTDQRLTIGTVTSVPHIGAPEVWRQQDPAGEDVRGAGSTIAVIDTGVDYSHPSLGEGFGPQHKVVAGYDFANNDEDPMDDQGHGTHVAGIAAGDGGEGLVTGVAPEATLTAYKVLDEAGGGYESDIIAGLEAAVDPANPYRADVVNLSLGGAGDGTDPLGRAATRASQLGAVVVAAAGNSGPGEQTVGTPAAAAGVLSVGASVTGVSAPVAKIKSPIDEPLGGFRVPFSAAGPQQPVSGAVIDVGLGRAEDYDRVGDVTGKIVAYRANLPSQMADVSDGMVEHARLAEERGAIAALAYSQSNTPMVEQLAGQTRSGQPAADAVATLQPKLSVQPDPWRLDKLVVIGLLDLQWTAIQRLLADGPVTIEVSAADLTDQVASFSSRGPTSRFDAGVDLVAPGVEISSSLPKANYEQGTYRMSGTSMASPHVAGAAALLHQLRPDLSGADLAAQLTGSAHPIAAGPTVQGAGRLDVAAAARATVLASPGTLDLGLAGNAAKSIKETGTVSWSNLGAKPITLDLTAERYGNAGRVSLSKTKITVPAGGSASVEVTVSGSLSGADQDFSGWLVATPAGGKLPPVRTPYLVAVRPLIVQPSPDPAETSSTALVWSPRPVTEPPTVTLIDPQGKEQRIRTVLDHGQWFRAALPLRRAGEFRVRATARTDTGVELVGSAFLEAIRPNARARWEPVGPNNSSGALAASDADPDRIVINQWGKLSPWFSGDGGQTWQQRPVWQVAAGSGEMVIDPDNPDAMWYAVNGTIGTGPLASVLDPTYQGTILRSRDGGRSWQRLAVPNASYQKLIMDEEGRVLVAVTADLILISTDGGETWSRTANPVGADLVGAGLTGSDLFLASYSTVWKVPGVVTGRPAAAELIIDQQPGIAGLVADAEQVAYLDREDRVLASTDGGANWREIFTEPDQSAYGLVLRSGTLMVYTLRGHQWLGQNHGAEWTKIADIAPGAPETDFLPRPNGDILWSTDRSGLYRAKEGAKPVRIGVPGETIYDLAVADRDGKPELIAGTRFATYDTPLPTGPVTPETAEWGSSGGEAYYGKTVHTLAAYPKDPSIVWRTMKTAAGDFRVERSDDGGRSWKSRGTTFEIPLDVSVSANSPDRVVNLFGSLVGFGLFATDDGGKTWQKFFHDQRFTVVEHDPADPERLWLGSAEGLFRSDDGGRTVSQVYDRPVTAITVTGDRIVVGGSGLAVSEDGGKSFRAGDSGSLPIRVTDVTVAGDTLYAGTASWFGNGLVKGGRGVLASTDGGATWHNVSAGLQNLSVTTLQLSPDARWLFAGTEEGGVHRLRLR